jgi:hypothetical protein
VRVALWPTISRRHRPRGSRREGDGDVLVAFAQDLGGPISPLEVEVSMSAPGPSEMRSPLRPAATPERDRGLSRSRLEPRAPSSLRSTPSVLDS